MICGQARHWASSMQDEVKSISENDTWQLVPMPQHDAKVIQGRWVFRTKTDANGKILKFKSRWVVRGFQQEEGSNYTNTFASVVKPMSYKVLFSIAAAQNFEIEQMDVKTAFLNSPIYEEVFVEQPHGFEVTTPAEETQLSDEILTPLSSKHTHRTASLCYPKARRTHVNMVC